MALLPRVALVLAAPVAIGTALGPEQPLPSPLGGDGWAFTGGEWVPSPEGGFTPPVACNPRPDQKNHNSSLPYVGCENHTFAFYTERAQNPAACPGHGHPTAPTSRPPGRTLPWTWTPT